MGIRDLKQSIILSMVDKFSRPANKAAGASTRVASKLRDTKRELGAVNKQAKNVKALTNVSNRMRDIDQKSGDAKTKLAELWKKIEDAKKTGKATKRLQQQFANTEKRIDTLSKRHSKLENRASSLTDQLKAESVETRDLAKAQDYLSSKTDKLNRKLTKQEKLLKVTQLGRKAGQMVSNFSKKAKGIALAGGIGIASIATPMIATAANFEEGMDRVASISRATGTQFDALRDKARELGRTTSFSASEATDGMAYLAMAGFKTNKIISTMPGVLKLAKASGSELGTTANITSNILTGFGLNADKMQHLGDVLTKTFTSSNTTLDSLGASMGKLGPIASSLGISLEDTAALAGSLGDVSFDGSRTETTLRAMFLRLSAPMGKAKETLKEMRIETRDSNKNFRNIIDIIGELDSATRLMGTGQRTEILKEIFGEEPAAGVAALLAKGKSGLAKYSQEIFEADGIRDRIAKQMGDNSKGHIKEWQSSIEDLSITVGDMFLPVLSDTVKKLTEFTRELSGWASKSPELIKTTAALTVGAIALVGGLAMIGTVAPKVVVGLKLIKLALISNPIGLAITGIAAGAALIYSNWDKLGPQFQELWEGLFRGFGKLGDKFKLVGTNIMSGITSGIDSGIASVKATLQSLGDMMPDWLRKPLGIRSPSRVFAKLGGHIAEGVGVGIENKTPSALNALSNMGNKLPGALPTALAMGLTAGGVNASPTIVKGGQLSASAGSTQQVTVQQTNHITINHTSDMTNQELKNMIERALLKVNQQAQTAISASLFDEL